MALLIIGLLKFIKICDKLHLITVRATFNLLGKKGLIMPRRARRNLKSKYLHVICQGINKEFIFNKKEHLEEYYKLMQIKKEKFDVEVLSYCIMNNHVHMLLYSEEIYNISHF